MLSSELKKSHASIFMGCKYQFHFASEDSHWKANNTSNWTVSLVSLLWFNFHFPTACSLLICLMLNTSFCITLAACWRFEKTELALESLKPVTLILHHRIYRSLCFCSAGWQMTTEPDKVITVRLILRQPSSVWLSFKVQDIKIYSSADEVSIKQRTSTQDEVFTFITG